MEEQSWWDRVSISIGTFIIAFALYGLGAVDAVIDWFRGKR